MIFVCVGSRKFQFDRLLKKIDLLISEGEIQEEVFAQIGASTYIPQQYKYKRYLSSNEFKEYQHKADLIITHGGTGAMLGALKLQKQVIAVPRLSKFGEHSDNHQTQVAGVLDKEGYLKCLTNMDELGNYIQELKCCPITKRYNEPSRVISIIEEFIDNNEK